MKNLIEQKNILLREASESLREVYRMSKVLADSKDMSAGVRGILIELVSEKLDELSSGWGGCTSSPTSRWKNPYK